MTQHLCLTEGNKDDVMGHWIHVALKMAVIQHDLNTTFTLKFKDSWLCKRLMVYFKYFKISDFTCT